MTEILTLPGEISDLHDVKQSLYMLISFLKIKHTHLPCPNTTILPSAPKLHISMIKKLNLALTYLEKESSQKSLHWTEINPEDAD